MAGMLGDEGDRFERLSLLPHPKGMLRSEGRGQPGASIDWTDWIAPEWVAALSQAVQAPRAAYEGADMDPRDALNMAGSVMGGGVLAPGGGGLGMGVRKPPRPILYHGSQERRKIIPDPKHAIETRGAAFLTDNENVAYTFTYPREYGEMMFYDAAGKELKPGRVTALHADMKNPKVLTEAEAQKFVDDSGFQQRVINEAREAGHDSVIAQGVLEGIGERYKGNVYAIFDKGMLTFAKKPKAPK